MIYLDGVARQLLLVTLHARRNNFDVIQVLVVACDPSQHDCDSIHALEVVRLLVPDEVGHLPTDLVLDKILQVVSHVFFLSSA